MNKKPESEEVRSVKYVSKMDSKSINNAVERTRI